MSMEHAPEFQPGREAKIAAEKLTAVEMSALYRKLFLGNDDGKRVLADLRRRFGIHRPVFVRNDRGQIDVNGGLLRDGERRVMTVIEAALNGEPMQEIV